MTVYEERDNPWVSIIIGLAAVALFAYGLLGCGPTHTAKDAVRGSQGPALPAQEGSRPLVGGPTGLSQEGVCVGPECGVPAPAMR